MKWSAMKWGMPVHRFIRVTVCCVKRPHKRGYIKYYSIVNIVNILQLQSRRNFFIVLLFFKNFCFFPTWSNLLIISSPSYHSSSPPRILSFLKCFLENKYVSARNKVTGTWELDEKGKWGFCCFIWGSQLTSLFSDWCLILHWSLSFKPLPLWDLYFCLLALGECM